MAIDAEPVAAADYPPGYPFAPQAAPVGQARAMERAPPDKFSLTAERSIRDEKIKWAASAYGLVVTCGLANLLIAPIVEALDAPVPLVGLAYAILLTELAALSLWTVWSERPLWQRVLLGAVVAEGLLACFLVGIRLSESGSPDFNEMARATLCSLPLVTLCVQAPLWALRIYALWRIVPDEAPFEKPPRPLSIGDMLLATVVVAVAVSLVRLASSDPEFYEFAWIAWSVAAPSIAAVSLASLPPALYLVLRSARPVTGLFILWGYATAAIVVVLVTSAILFGARLRSEEVLGLLVTVYGFASLVWLLLSVARAWNYRLIIRG